MFKYLAQSAVGSGVDPAGAVSNLSADDVGVILERIITWLFSALMVFAVLAIFFAAFKYATAGDKAENVRTANSALIYSVIAIGVAFLSRGLSYLVIQLISP